jgi:excisionase family DNA binding protein
MDNLTITQVASLLGITRQAVYNAVSKGQIKSEKDAMGIHRINFTEIETYQQKKYHKQFATYNGELVFDKAKGEMTVNEAAIYLNTTYSIVHYQIRKGLIPSIKKGGCVVINIKDLEKFKEKNKTMAM